MKNEITNEYVKYVFTDEEKKEMSTELALKVSNQSTAEDEKKAIMSDLKSKIDSLAAQSNNLANKLNNGYEMRIVKCEVVKDFKKNTVKIMRCDTGEVIKTREMSHEDRQETIE